ncbi:MAG: hypothetical protein GF350_05610 [Chitinivibrionales bacterium]|nr:hypothetical protein [Chitinivibrionales bacterium]
MVAAGSARGQTSTGEEIANRYLFFQQTVYLENIYTPGGWWANPALLSDIDSKTLLTSNVAPLTGKYVIASARMFFPVRTFFNCGIGVLGTGLYEKTSETSTTIDNEGVSSSGSFSFDRPSLQVGIGKSLDVLGKFGLLTAFGYENPRDIQRSQRSFIWSIGGGAISPLFFDIAGFSVALISTGIINVESRWSHDGKFGTHFSFMDSLITLTADLSFTSGSSLGLWSWPVGDYQVFKTLVSIRTFGILGTLAGFSSDLENARPVDDYYSFNGNCIHGGVEIRQSDAYPYFGGVDMGISFNHRGHIFLRFWFGYEFDGKHETSS